MKRLLLEYLEKQRRTLVYVGLISVQPDYRWDTVTNLRMAKVRYDALLTIAKDRVGRDKQTTVITHKISRSNQPSFFKLLEKGKKSTFTISWNDPEFNKNGTSYVSVTSLTLAAKGVKSQSGKFSAKIVHNGNSSFKDARGYLWSFSHDPRPTNLYYEVLGDGTIKQVAGDVADNNLGAGADYIELSPFASWTFSLDAGDGVEVSKITEIEFKFETHLIALLNAAELGNDLMHLLKDGFEQAARAA